MVPPKLRDFSRHFKADKGATLGSLRMRKKRKVTADQTLSPPAPSLDLDPVTFSFIIAYIIIYDYSKKCKSFFDFFAEIFLFSSNTLDFFALIEYNKRKNIFTRSFLC